MLIVLIVLTEEAEQRPLGVQAVVSPASTSCCCGTLMKTFGKHAAMALLTQSPQLRTPAGTPWGRPPLPSDDFSSSKRS